jgi:transposase
MVWDNAAYQRCNFVRFVAERLKIELLFLPSYSPNLSLIERLWRVVKKECIYGKHYATFTEFQGALDRCLAETSTRHRAVLETLITNRFQLYPLESTAA